MSNILAIVAVIKTLKLTPNSCGTCVFVVVCKLFQACTSLTVHNDNVFFLLHTEYNITHKSPNYTELN